MVKTSLLIVDDHKLMLEGMKRLLEDQETVYVRGVASGGEEALEMLSLDEYDVVLLDISMPVMNGIETLREIRKRKHNTKVIMITMHHDFTSVSGSIHKGADGYILKDSGVEEILTAIDLILRGGIYISPVIKEMLTEMSYLDVSQDGLPDPYSLLSDRELQIAKLFAHGKTSAEIADELFVSAHTIETHRRNIFQKLKVNKTSALVKYMYENSLM